MSHFTARAPVMKATEQPRMAGPRLSIFIISGPSDSNL